MRGNRYAKGADPNKSRAQRKRDKQSKLERCPRRQRLRRRLARVDQYKNKQQQGEHMTALMESFALRRQSERKKEKEKLQQKEEDEDQQQQQQRAAPKRQTAPAAAAGGGGARRSAVASTSAASAAPRGRGVAKHQSHNGSRGSAEGGAITFRRVE